MGASMSPPEFACPLCQGPLDLQASGLSCKPCERPFLAGFGGFDLRGDTSDSNKEVQAEIYNGMMGALSDFDHPHNLGLQHQKGLLEGLSLQPGDSVLEIGGHRSGVLPFLENHRGIQGRGLDISAEWVREQNRLASERKADTQWVLGDAERLPFAEGQFKAIVSFDVFEHLSDIGAAVKECARVLAPGGQLLCHMPVQDVRWSLDGLQQRLIGDLWRSRQESVGHFHDTMLSAALATQLFETAGLTVRDHGRFNVWIQPIHDHKWMAWLGKRRHSGKSTQERSLESSSPGKAPKPRFQRLYAQLALPIVTLLASPDRIGQKLGIGGSAWWVLEKP
jgi:ubiquinone/menaquinone biosynthesis C-methylase UbiE